MKIDHPETTCMSDEQVWQQGDVFAEGFRRGLLQARIMMSFPIYLAERKGNDAAQLRTLYELFGEQARKFQGER
jgi:hypothetical protein